jgi:FkbM family methyltransferase
VLQLFPELRETGLDYVDIGCRGNVEARWLPVAALLNYVGFDADGTEVARLERAPGPYRCRRYFPYAVGGTEGPAVLYCTESPECSSLLRPRAAWMRRLNGSGAFRETGQMSVDVVTLDGLRQREGLRADILKIDSQGMELPILQNAQELLAEVFCVETETGFVENYVGETVAAQVDAMLRPRGFLMFDVKVHRVGRNNPLAGWSVQQPYYCEAVWLRDYLAEASWGIPVAQPGRSAAIKALLICWVLGVADYGFELAEHFHSRGVLTDAELDRLRAPHLWDSRPGKPAAQTLVIDALRLLPGGLRRGFASAAAWVATAADAAQQRPHLLRRTGRRRQ